MYMGPWVFGLILVGSFAIALHDDIPDPGISSLVLTFGILAIVGTIVESLVVIAQRLEL
jgi:hypothetical protein